MRERERERMTARETDRLEERERERLRGSEGFPKVGESTRVSFKLLQRYFSNMLNSNRSLPFELLG